MENNNLCITINYKTEGNYSEVIRDGELANYSNNISNKYLICRGKRNKNGGTIIFKARDFKEAEEILNNSLTKNEIYKLLIDVI